jgi:two-component system, NarL family, nitrate/nitrite response regulator NarL
MIVHYKKECVVLIASHSPDVRRRLKNALSGLFFVYNATDRPEMDQKILKLKPAVVFVDLDLPRLEGLKSIPEILRLSSLTKVVLLSETPDENEELIALKAGVKGYCHKDIDHILIKKAVHVLQKGEIWAERGIITRLLKELTDSNIPTKQHSSVRTGNLELLTPRQSDIAWQISNGASNKEIAHSLRISEATVKAHIHAIFRKIGVSDRLALAIFVREKAGIAK